MENSEEYKRAKARAEAKMGFYIHLFVYVAVMLLLLTINLAFSRDSMWVQWPMMGWGIAVVIHGVMSFVFPNGLVANEKMIQRELKKGPK